MGMYGVKQQRHEAVNVRMSRSTAPSTVISMPITITTHRHDEVVAAMVAMDGKGLLPLQQQQ